MDDVWNELKSQVKRAIERGDASLINFCYQDVYQCKYQQKCAEDELWFYGHVINVSVFLGALVFGIIFSNIDIKLNDNFIKGMVFGIILIVGIVIYGLKPRYNTCRKIILNTEKAIQIFNKEKDKL